MMATMTLMVMKFATENRKVPIQIHRLLASS
jgi:hypothetical protein